MAAISGIDLMVEFLTLFLGLLSGPQAVEVSVTEEVAKVELRLDGAIVATLEGEPWRAEIDLGAALVPHRLEAVALNADDALIHRAEQVLNVARARALLRIILGRPRDDGTRDGRLVWLAADSARPKRVTVTLDGEPLDVVAGRAFRLPFVDLDTEEVHMVSAIADFPGGIVASATLLLGGVYGESVTTQLTAVPVVLEDGVELPEPEAMKGWLERGGEPLEVMAVESRGAEVVVVRDRGALAPLSEMRFRFREQRHRRIGKLGPRHTLRLLEATPSRERLGDDGPEFEKYRLSEPLSDGHGGLPWILGTEFFRDASPFDLEARRLDDGGLPPQHLADAVANAGLTAAASGWLRAVVLVLGPRPQDQSQWSPERVRGYLETLRVPLHVWSITSDARRQQLGDAPEWAPAADVSTSPEYLEAVGRLVRDLKTQRLLWVRGEHFVHDVHLAPHVEGVRLAP